MSKASDDTAFTLDDEQIVTRRRVIGLAALALGAASTLVSTPALADDTEESDSASESSDDSSESHDDSDDNTEEESGDSDG